MTPTGPYCIVGIWPLTPLLHQFQLSDMEAISTSFPLPLTSLGENRVTLWLASKHCFVLLSMGPGIQPVRPALATRDAVMTSDPKTPHPPPPSASHH